MTNTSFDLSEKPELREIANALAIIAEAAKKLGASWFVVGATARDLILSECYGLATSSKTYDVDVAVNVRSWSDFNELRRVLLERGDITSGSAPHRFHFPNSLVVDIVPFGAIEKNGVIEWPGEDREMNLTGFDEASHSTVELILPNDVAVDVVSLPGLLLLKLIAWQDRHHRERQHDGSDIRELIVSYSEDWNLDRLYEEADDYLAMYGYDPELAAAALLGSDLRRACGGATMAVTEILDRECDPEGQLLLARDMGTAVEQNLRLLQSLKNGFDTTPRS